MNKTMGLLAITIIVATTAWAVPAPEQKPEPLVEREFRLGKIFQKDFLKEQTAMTKALAAAKMALPALEASKLGAISLKLERLQDFDFEGLQDRQEDRAREQAERAREMADRMKERTREMAERGREQSDRADSLYEQGSNYLDEGRWDRAAGVFDRVASGKGSRADGALYWKAYALNKQGQREPALATLASLREGYPNSRWLNDAKALEVEVRQNSGQPVRPENESDNDLKLLALNSLMHSDPDNALPVLEKFLKGNQPPKLKQKALFVLAQNPSPKSRELLAQFARGQTNPDLQLKAVEYLGQFGGKETHQVLSEIYASSTDTIVKKRILRSFMISNDRERVFNAAKSEQNPELRREAIRLLGTMGNRKRGGSDASPGEVEELFKLYQSETSVDVKKEILNAMFISGNSDRLTELARNEREPTLRRSAIQKLGIMGPKTADALVSLYASEKEYEVKREILNALFIHGNAKNLVDIARKETDPTLKKDAVSKLALMKSKEATDFMMEILK